MFFKSMKNMNTYTLPFYDFSFFGCIILKTLSPICK